MNAALICELVMGTLLVCLNIMRIRNIPITFDECDSWKLIQRDPWDILLHFEGSANNHILNTILQRLFTGILGNNLFALRAGSLLAQIVFLIYTAMIGRRLFHNTGWQVCSFLLINLHPFMFEFWGLGRGYGLAIACMTGSVYHMIVYMQSGKLTALIAATLLAALSVLSNFALLNYYCAIAGAGVLLPLLYQTRGGGAKLLRATAAIVAISTALYILIAGPIKTLQMANLFFYGGETGFLNDTIGSLVRYNLHTTNEILIIGMAYVLAMIFLAGGAYWAINRKDQRSRMGVLLWLLVAIPAAAVITQHALLATKYLTDRTGMFFIVLYMLHLIYWLHACKTSTLLVIVRNVLTGLAAGHFLLRMNTGYVEIWHTDIYNRIVLDRISVEAKMIGPKKLCTYWISYPSMQYHVTEYKELITLAEVGGGKCSDTAFDYYYLPEFKLGELPVIYKQDTAFAGGIYFRPGERFYLMKKSRR